MEREKERKGGRLYDSIPGIYREVFPNLHMPVLRQADFPQSHLTDNLERERKAVDIPMWTKSFIIVSQCKCLWWQVKNVSGMQAG